MENNRSEYNQTNQYQTISTMKNNNDNLVNSTPAHANVTQGYINITTINIDHLLVCSKLIYNL